MPTRREQFEQSRAIAHVFIDLISSHDENEPTDTAGEKAILTMGRVIELEAVTIHPGNQIDITPLIAGAALAMQSLLEAVEREGMERDAAIIAWRDELDR